MSDYSLNKAIFILQSSTASLDDKVRCLRYLKEIISESSNGNNTLVLDIYHRQGINQLIFDNILKIVLNDERSFGGKRVHVELYLILADLLASEPLFTGRLEQVAQAIEMKGNPLMETENSGADTMTKLDTTPNSLEGRVHFSKKSRSRKSDISDLCDEIRSVSDADSKISLLKPIISMQIRKRATLMTLSKSLKPRPSVIFQDKYEPNYFVPGANPYDFFEQDKKLGYQKSRMWFPAAKANVAASLIPLGREATPKKSLAERVVQEFLQMRALASYVGDSVLPFDPKKSVKNSHEDAPFTESFSSTASTPSSIVSSATSKTVKRLTGFLTGQYDLTVEESMRIWNPLQGVRIPKWNSSESSQKNEEKRFDRLAPYRYFEPTKHSNAPKSNEKDESTESLDDLESISILDAMRPEDKNENALLPVDVNRFQADIDNALEERRRSIEASIRLSETLISQTIKSQYALFPQKFLQIIDGSKADARGKVARAFLIFCKVKRRNYLALALGIWKITLLKKATEARHPIYCRMAATYLIFSWVINMRKKNLTKWIVCWRESVTRCIFLQRNVHAILIQTLYRTWRDRRRLIQMHNVAYYNGILSDIYLAPQRKDLPFFIPHTIRNTRRLYWLAARNIQTRFRCWINGREYRIRRRRLVLLQSVVRMFPKRKQFLRLKYWTIKCQSWARRSIQQNRYKLYRRAAITIQKYTRRYLGQLLKWRLLDVIWRDWEKRMASSIIIQQRWREHVARKAIRKIRFRKAMEQYAALVIQRNYFRMKRAFHTFFLTCVYRVREIEDKKLDHLATTMGRYKASRLIIRRYRLRYFKRNISAVVKVQCWFRGRLGYSIVTILRRYRWAHRKLCHWGRGMLRRRHAFVRTIQRWWWHLKKGRLLKHLWYKAYLRDLKMIKEEKERRHYAASKIQAYVNGVWDRRWVKRHRAALKIQKNWKFFFGIKKWKRAKAEKIRHNIRKFVQSCIDVAIKKRSKILVALHSTMLVKVQSLVRAFIVRSIMARARLVAYEIGMAAITIQRYWRKAVAVAQAVEEAMAAKRMQSNPFRDSSSAHEVLLLLRQYSSKLYDTRDPRVGMKITTLLARMGHLDLADMFPKKDYIFVSDLSSLTIKKMVQLYDNMQNRNMRKKQQKKQNDDSSQNQPKKKVGKSSAPMNILQSILDIASPSLYVKDPDKFKIVRTIHALPEGFSPQDAFLSARSTFLRKFGKTLQARANNVSRDLVNMAFVKYNNFKVFDTVTFAQYARAVATCNESSQLISNLNEIISKNKPTPEDRRWDKERVTKCADLIQLAVDSIGKFLPPGMLRDLVEKTNNRMIYFKRKFEFTRKRFKNQLKKQKKKQPQAAPLPPPNAKQSKSRKQEGPQHNRELKYGELPVINDESDVELIPKDLMSTSESVDLPFNGNLEDFDLEYNISLCKIYFDLLHKLHVVSYGIQSLKNAWSNKAMRRVLYRDRISRFLQEKTNEYFKQQQLDRVQLTWNRIRKRDINAKKVALMISAAQTRKLNIERQLGGILKHGWIKMKDDNDYPFWVYMGAKAREPVDEMPTYNLSQWYSAIKIQRVARLYIVIRKKIREEKERQELLEMQRAAEKQLAESLRAERSPVQVSFRYVSKYTDSERNKNVSATPKSIIPPVEDLLPWNFRFESNPILTSGTWALLKQGNSYEVVVIFKLRKERGRELCCARSVKGKKHVDIPIKEMIFQMNLDVGTEVECRYRNKKLFYRSKISKVIEKGTSPKFCVTYEDGEREENLGRDVIRPTKAAVEAFLKGREQLLPLAAMQHRRLEHFSSLKQKRTSSFYTSSTASKATTKTFVKVSYKYLRHCLRYGWSRLDPLQQHVRQLLHAGDDSASAGPSYINDFTSETTTVPPKYTQSEIFSVSRIQRAWLIYKANKVVRKAVLQIPLRRIIRETISKCASIAYVGFGFEGANVIQMLRRVGCWDVADSLEASCKTKKLDINSFSLESISQKQKEDFELMGVTSATQIRSLKEFQLWWKRTSAAEREKKLALFNYYSSPSDSRTIQQCIADSEDVIAKKFLKVISTGTTKTRLACRSIVAESIFPHSHQQIEAYLKKYGDKPELARESIFELVNKRTTHTWVEEAKVLKKFRHISHVIGCILKVLKLRKLHRRVFNVGRQADEIFKLTATLNSKTRPNCSGHEAKAALLLRADVLEIVAKYISSSILIQKVFRRHFFSSRWRVLLKRRIYAVSVIQGASRRKLAYKVAQRLREQRDSEWEQLWNPAKNLLYYYNYVTKKSQYNEPEGPFRPLIRDRLSAGLMQAWPEIDNRRGMNALLPGDSKPVVPGILCGVCNTRRCIRECLQCVTTSFYDVNTQAYVFPYCFSCYVREHGENGDKADHEFVVIGESNYDLAPSLRCCMCEEPSTRKCLGPLDDQQVDEICKQLKRTKLNRWREVLANNNVGGERKLDLLLDQFHGIGGSNSSHGTEDLSVFDEGTLASPQNITATSAQLQSVRTMLEQIRAECDECYCTSCYEEVHSGGRRKLHKWKGHQQFCPVCVVCGNSPAESDCLDCATQYCEPCSKVFHSMGRKRRHKQQLLLETVGDCQGFCKYCSRRVADTPCPNDADGCEVYACDSCLEFKHKPRCAQELQETMQQQNKARGKGFLASSKSNNSMVVATRNNKPTTAPDGLVCAVCEEEADSICLQCGDAYCSKVWMGNPGCFINVHSRGNRASHILQPLQSKAPTSPTMLPLISKKKF